MSNTYRVRAALTVDIAAKDADAAESEVISFLTLLGEEGEGLDAHAIAAPVSIDADSQIEQDQQAGQR